MARYFIMSDFAGFPAGTEIISISPPEQKFDRVQMVDSSFTFSPPKDIIFAYESNENGYMDGVIFYDKDGYSAGFFDIVALVIQLAEARQQLKDLQNGL